MTLDDNVHGLRLHAIQRAEAVGNVSAVCPHSVVTAHLIDEASQPTIAARDEILSFFARRLVPPV